ncbi:hypothetical protein NEOLI_001669 [Neolecta irregularis DAH-3]|uniref:Uncharacterized protein n=1 Tax=Neolecta irregularis (strain DAH-3) TaxID=1198029 RepID=A0A1U7LLY2_NEOID|nr:hypothetical protein NEOLI_001669 [Neolecta irregularis DAH-3]|eukprot:OLL23657.1 hypothetical protein NEOLI_001669 [Neolecta irregularis DAH-3]
MASKENLSTDIVPFTVGRGGCGNLHTKRPGAITPQTPPLLPDSSQLISKGRGGSGNLYPAEEQPDKNNAPVIDVTGPQSLGRGGIGNVSGR